VWGFLKYHHPRVAAGELHWDYELLRVLPRVLDARDFEAATAILADFVDNVPGFPDCTACAEPPQNVHLQPDLAWIHDRELLGDDLATLLESVYRNRHASGPQFFVALQPNVGNPNFTNEQPYKQFKLPDAGFRLLALFRFWNIIRYWFPYRDLIGEDWDHVLAEFVPRLALARDPDRYKLELMALIAHAHDTHANLWSSLDVQPPVGKLQLPVTVRFIEGVPVVTGFPHAAGKAGSLKLGDVLRSLDGATFESLVADWQPYYAASNDPTRRRDIGRNFTRGDKSTCHVRLERDGKPLELDVERVPTGTIDPQSGATHDLAGEVFRLLSPEVGYLKLSAVKLDQVASYLRGASGTRGLVIDIRNYPSAFVVFALGQHLVSEPTPFARFTNGDLANPGAFVWTEPLALQPEAPRYEGKVVILIDEVSQSQAEYTTMAFRAAPGAVVVGSTTAGADGNVSAIPMPGGLSTMISGIGVFYPDHRPTQRVGILADVEARPTIEGVRQGRDEVLEVALRQILGGTVLQEEIVRMARH
jgi:C-terminal processing protease CtpA/Prc